MIGYLNGKLLQAEPGRWLVRVGGMDSGVGYSVLVPGSGAYQGAMAGDTVELWIHTHVREDALDLFGFLTPQEKELYLVCLSVNGIGPKGGLGLLSHLEPQRFIQAILEGDKETLHALPGVGKKTAERLVLELRDPIRKRVESGALGAWGEAPRVAQSGAKSQVPTALAGGVPREVREALLGLGYREIEVNAMLERARVALDVVEGATQSVPAEDWIRTALQGGQA